LAAGLLGLGGCSSEQQPTLSHTVSIDPAFTADQMDAVTAGVGDWKAAIGELQFTLAVAPCDAPSAAELCIHPAHNPPAASNDVVGTTQPGSSDNATLWIYVDRIEACSDARDERDWRWDGRDSFDCPARWDVQAITMQTAAHEIGHAFGLMHKDPGELMAADVLEQANTVTPADVAQFWAVRGR
jgi:hypothetical protein